MGSGQKDEEMICALTADEREVLQKGLRALSDTMPPRAVWSRVREQAEAEGLLTDSPLKKRATWYGGAGLAAAALLAAVLLPGRLNPPTETFPVVPTNVPSNAVGVSTLQALMVQSRQLESDLRSLPDEPRVMRAGTVATISDLEDRIAAIDYQLNDPEVHMTPEDQELFWRERVRLMKSLLQLRYAQAQRAAF
ncbi:MAG: hypothetical protein KJP16_13695 [Gammaproteobacteria bacterium]|nr:hypothetical protein [Gammaproteobacteria bacterium]NNL51860.1 hypothetical protein [Woeseiaceae bacterium]